MIFLANMDDDFMDQFSYYLFHLISKYVALIFYWVLARAACISLCRY
jgi:hypothetical protein